MIKLLICDDHILVAEGIELMLGDEPNLKVSKIVSSGKDAVNYLLEHNEIDVLILDLSMKNMNGIEVLKELNFHSIKTKVLILTMHDDIENIKKAMANGANGYLLKSTNKEKFVIAIQKIIKGETFMDQQLTATLLNEINNKPKKINTNTIELTKRENDILKLIVKSKKTKDIAEELFISVNTVLSHRKNIYSKFHVHSVSELISYVYKHKYLNEFE